MSTELLIESNVSKKILFECLDLAKEFENKYSAYKDSSLLSRINKASGKEAVECNDEDLEIFQKAMKIAKLSDGAFDPTIGILTQGIYGFGTKNQKIPSSSELQKAKKLVNYEFVDIKNNKIFLTKDGMRLDLGGIGKVMLQIKL